MPQINLRSLTGKCDPAVEQQLRDVVLAINALPPSPADVIANLQGQLAGLLQRHQNLLARFDALTASGSSVAVDGALEGDGTVTNPLAVKVDGTTVQIVGDELTAPGGGSGITQLTGDVTAGPGSGSQAATLSNTGVTPGTYGDSTTVAQFTVDAKGRLTFADDVPIDFPAANLYPVMLVVGDGVNDITTGIKGYAEVEVAGTVTAWTVLSTDPAATAGLIEFGVFLDPIASYPPTTSITGGNNPGLSSSPPTNYEQDYTLSGWSPTVAAGDVFGFSVISNTGITRAALVLWVDPS